MVAALLNRFFRQTDMGTALQDVRLLFHSTAIFGFQQEGCTLPFGKQQVSRRLRHCRPPI
jgi:hypothetical protein